MSKANNQTTGNEKTPARRAGPFKFFRQVKSEGKKVTWPTRQETTVSTIAVFIMVSIASVFLYFADQLIAFVIRLIMSFGL